VQVQLGGGVLVDGLEEPEELLMAVSSLVLADDLAGGDVEGGEKACGAVSDVAVVLRPGRPGIIGSIGAVRSSACICFQSTVADTQTEHGWVLSPSTEVVRPAGLSDSAPAS
jgi:hypothetical protein